MKPIKLTICGINSYKTPQIINFEQLAESNLFGIFGQTGSGKSTILDSIIIALYGSSDRENLSNIINVNLLDANVEFEFEIEKNNKKIYKVKRTFKNRPSGFKSTAELTNVTDKITLGETTDKVNAEVLKLIGVGKKEFIKCIALPQNEFDKFIMDTPSERKKSIAKLFDIEEFGDELNKKLKSRIDILTTEKNLIEKQLNSFSNISEENQLNLESIIYNTKHQINETNNLINSKKNELNGLTNLEHKFNEFNDIKVALNDIKQKETQYINLQNDLNFYSNNKTNIKTYNELKLNIKSLDEKVELEKATKIELLDRKNTLKNLENNLKEYNEKIIIENEKYNYFKLQLDKTNIYLTEVEKLSNELKGLEKEQKNNLLETKRLTSLLKVLKEEINKLNKNKESLQNDIKQFEKIEKTIIDFSLIEFSLDVVNKLKDIKTNFSKDDILEIKGYKIFDKINLVIDSINNLIEYYNILITNNKKSINDLKINLKEVNKIKTENSILIKNAQNNLKTILENLNKKNNDKIEKEIEIKNLLKEANVIKSKILLVVNKLNETKTKLNGEHLIDNSNNIINLNGLMEKVVKQIEKEKLDIKNLELKQSTLKIEIEYLKKNINKLKATLPTNFGITELKINEDNLVSLQNELNNYLTNKAYYQTQFNKLENELKNKKINLNNINKLKLEIFNLENEQGNLQIKLGETMATYNSNEEILIKNNTLENDIETITKNLNTALKLQNYISKNALVDYVAEEYMVLITEYANKFVSRISRGKYMLAFDFDSSELIVIDNFNAGIKRSIKSLSGGERFIFSLSLALGISQSIAVNNNKTFNFFFIDEGFGNLSDDYIDDVLNCFDSLIKLDFTVGFITHVDKMQEYITNKVIVTKENNDGGSVITQYN